MKNYHSALQQLKAFGLKIDSIIVDSRVHRCRANKGREKSGWYLLHEMRLDNGESLVTGTYGEWVGAEKNTQKVELDKEGYVFTSEQQEAMRKRAADDRKRIEAEQKQRAERCAQAAEHLLGKMSVAGDCDYLTRKGIGAYGVKFSEKNSLIIPVTDTRGKVHGLQIILDSKISKERIEKLGRDKEFYPSGMAKKGHFHLIGSPTNIVLVAEGYATAATLHEATGFPVACAFDANNIEPVIANLKKHYRNINFLICADNDSLATCRECKTYIDLEINPTFCHQCGKPHTKKNTGIERANLAAMTHACAVVYPVFADNPARFLSYQKNQGKLTDFNDLMHVESLATVRFQVEQAIAAKGWRVQGGARQTEGAGESDGFATLLSSVNDILQRFTLLEGQKSTFFDHKERKLILKKDIEDLCRSRELMGRWRERGDRVVGKIEEFGFDAAETDTTIKYNIWNGMPTQPIQGECDLIKDLLFFLVNENLAHYQYVLKWLAYPLQHPGAKLKTSLVFHGGQGTGKNLFFEAYAAIYGRYAKVIDQSAIEDKFNTWVSGKLFLIADEVIARHDLFQLKNKLKAIITGDTIRINPKNLPDYFEKNQFNMVYLSNEIQPVVLEQDDRRHSVFWIKGKQDDDFYKSVAAEIKNGGVSAFYHYLLHLDCGDFNEHTKPVDTDDKKELIDLNRNPIQRFFFHGWVANWTMFKCNLPFQRMFMNSIARGV
jgi:putative DNA primase/helicase